MLWKPEYALGIRAMDNQHQELFQRMNQLSQALAQGSPQEETTRTLSFLTDYVENHFAFEEAWMLQIKYPKRPEHLAAHQALRQELEELTRAFHVGGNERALGERLLARLSQWLVDHILGTDQELGAFLRTLYHYP